MFLNSFGYRHPELHALVPPNIHLFSWPEIMRTCKCENNIATSRVTRAGSRKVLSVIVHCIPQANTLVIGWWDRRGDLSIRTNHQRYGEQNELGSGAIRDSLHQTSKAGHFLSVAQPDVMEARVPQNIDIQRGAEDNTRFTSPWHTNQTLSGRPSPNPVAVCQARIHSPGNIVASASLSQGTH